tara:strand:- start:368 stop:1030 length:663 start_codon:yes stop_codon:yes gene_type:complete
MDFNICNVRTRWINVDKDVEKAQQMQELLDGLEFTNHQRFSAVTGIAPHEGVRKGEEHYRNCAESHFKILEQTILKDGEPVLILEDDVDLEKEAFVKEFPLPKDADAIYFGTSHGDNSYEAIDQGNGYNKIVRVYATHAIMYLNPEFAKKTIEDGKTHIYKHNRPFDLALAYEVQPKFNVYAPYVPYFYQADAKNSVNKWENVTRPPLNKKKKFSVWTIE